MGKIFFPEQLKIVEAIAPITNTAAVTGDYVNLKNAKMAWVVLHFTGAAATTSVVSIYQSKVVAGTSGAASTVSFKWYHNVSTTATDTLVYQTDAATLALGTSAADEIIVCQVDPAVLADTYDNIAVHITASTQATNYVEAMYYLQTAYPADQPPAAITS